MPTICTPSSPTVFLHFVVFFLMTLRSPRFPLFPYTTLFRSHTDQERDYFMQRYHDVISSFGGKTSYDADNRHKRFYLQKIGRAVQQECRDRARMPSSA